MSIEVLDSLKQQIGNLSESERAALAHWILERSDRSNRSDNHAKQRRREWMNANRRKYGGLYVALDGDQLLGTGKTFPEAYDVAQKAGKPDAFVDFVIPDEYVGEIGGLE